MIYTTGPPFKKQKEESTKKENLIMKNTIKRKEFNHDYIHEKSHHSVLSAGN